MSVSYKDYYGILGVSRSASQSDIKRAYRKLAKRYHPDVDKSSDGEKRYREINEAYEVLKDSEKRKLYDELGPDWQNGRNFTPPGGGPGGRHFHGAPGGNFGGFSDFFQTIFGDMAGGGGASGGMEDLLFGRGRGGRASGGRASGGDSEVELELSLEELNAGGLRRTFDIQSYERTSDGRTVPRTRRIDVNLPRGIVDGSRVRLRGKGSPGVAGSPPGDLYIRIRLRGDSRFEVSGHDLTTTIQVTPWEAALGKSLRVETLGGRVTMKLPAGAQGGQKMRLRGKGLPKRGEGFGDLYVRVEIAIPRVLSARERELFEILARESSFRPRSE